MRIKDLFRKKQQIPEHPEAHLKFDTVLDNHVVRELYLARIDGVCTGMGFPDKFDYLFDQEVQRVRIKSIQHEVKKTSGDAMVYFSTDKRKDTPLINFFDTYANQIEEAARSGVSGKETLIRKVDYLRGISGRLKREEEVALPRQDLEMVLAGAETMVDVRIKESLGQNYTAYRKRRRRIEQRAEFAELFGRKN